MGIQACKTIVCDITGQSHTETKPGAGFPGWGQLQGMFIRRDEDGLVISDPCLCPDVMVELVVKVCEMIDEHSPIKKEGG